MRNGRSLDWLSGTDGTESVLTMNQKCPVNGAFVLERVIRFELTTPCLGSKCSTN
jgi:hypothetical protein